MRKSLNNIPSFAGARLLTPMVLRVREWVLSLVDWRPATVCLPRSECHYLSLDVRGVPLRMLAGSVRLQLLQLTGLSRPGFAFRQQDDKALVWYWDEEADLPRQLASRKKSGAAGGVALWPESILRQMPADGLHLLRLSQGYEALSIRRGEIHRTRWFADSPSPVAWASFVRDAGYPVKGDVPEAETGSLAVQAPKGWKLHSTFLEPIPYQAWLVAGILALAGSGLLAAAIYQLKLSMAINAEQQRVEQISRENANTIELQRQIDDQAVYLGQLQLAQPKVLQLELMQALLDSGLVDEAGNTSLLEWEYRNNQLRLLFSVPATEFVLSEFLARLEVLPIFREVRLLPDTPPRTVGVQAVLAPRQARPEKKEAPPASTAPDEVTAQGAVTE